MNKAYSVLFAAVLTVGLGSPCSAQLGANREVKALALRWTVSHSWNVSVEPGGWQAVTAPSAMLSMSQGAWGYSDTTQPCLDATTNDPEEPFNIGGACYVAWNCISSTDVPPCGDASGDNSDGVDSGDLVLEALTASSSIVGGYFGPFDSRGSSSSAISFSSPWSGTGTTGFDHFIMQLVQKYKCDLATTPPAVNSTTNAITMCQSLSASIRNIEVEQVGEEDMEIDRGLTFSSVFGVFLYDCSGSSLELSDARPVQIYFFQQAGLITTALGATSDDPAPIAGMLIVDGDGNLTALGDALELT